MRLWDVATGKEIRRCQGHQGGVSSVAYSPDGKTLASGSADKTMRLWDVATGKEIRRFQGHQGAVLSVAYSPDGKTLASGSDDQTVRLWDVATGKEIRSLRGPSRPGHFRGVFAETAKRWPRGVGTRRCGCGTWPRARKSAASRGIRTRVSSRGVFAGRQDAGLGELGPDGAAVGRGHRQGNPHPPRASNEVLSVAYSRTARHWPRGVMDKTVRLWDVAKAMTTVSS